MHSLLQASQGWTQTVKWAVLLPRCSREIPFSRIIQVVGRIQFLESVVLKPQFSYWLLAGSALPF